MSHTSYRELEPEGEKMFKNLSEIMDKMDKATKDKRDTLIEELNTRKTIVVTKVTKPAKLVINMLPYQAEYLEIVREIKKLIANSEAVVTDCDRVIATYTTKEEYLHSDHRVAKHIHTNIAKRLSRVLQGLPAFESPPEVKT